MLPACGSSRGAGLVLPGEVLLAHHTKLTLGLAVAGRVGAGILVARGIGAVGGRKRIQVIGQLRLQCARNGAHPERRERHQVAVELADPVDQAIAAGVGDQHVATRAAVGAVLVGRMGIGLVVQTSIGRLVVVGVQQVVAPAAVHVVAPGAADQPVVAEVAEDPVVAVVVHWAVVGVLLSGRLRHRAARAEDTLRLVEIRRRKRV